MNGQTGSSISCFIMYKLCSVNMNSLSYVLLIVLNCTFVFITIHLCTFFVFMSSHGEVQYSMTDMFIRIKSCAFFQRVCN
jgi:hypothetical protein